MSISTKCFSLVVSVGLLLGCGTSEVSTLPVEKTPDQSPVPATAEVNRQEFGSFAFEVPAGWTSITPDRDKTKAMLLLGGSDWQNAKGMIKVDVGSPAFPTTEEMAGAFAKSVGGEVAADKIDFDGEPAAKATAAGTTLDMPRELLVSYRDGKAYLIMAAGVQDVDLTEAIEHVRSTWKWNVSEPGAQ